MAICEDDFPAGLPCLRLQPGDGGGLEVEDVSGRLLSSCLDHFGNKSDIL